MHKCFCIIILLTSAFVLAAQASPAQQSLPAEPAQVPAQLLEPGKAIERELHEGETHAYTIALQAREFLRATVDQRGIDVIVRVFAPDGAKLAEVDSPNGINGPEPVALEAKVAGTYRIEVAPLEKGVKPGRYEIKIDEILSAKQYAAYLEEKRVKREAVIKWLTANAVPIKTVEAGNGFYDLQPLKRILKTARFVGLGEETHGTREFFQFKHRMLEFLVREMGFRVFAIEASYSACQNINDYVSGKTADGASALDSQGFWTWNTEEVRAMLDWMRAYNASAPADKKVKFVGFDIQINQPGKDRLLDYLKRVAPERANEANEFFKINLDELDPFSRTPDKQKEAAAKLKELQIKYDGLFMFLELNQARLIAKSSPAELDQMREYARVLAQYLSAFGDLSDFGLRDLYMADNFKRLVEREPEGTRFVLWAHNGHIDASENSSSGFGNYLRRFFGNEYYALGFSFDHGSFQAREQFPKDPTKRMLRAYAASPATEESIDWCLAQTKIKKLFVDLRSPAKPQAVVEWLSAPQPMRSIGSLYSSEREQNFIGPVTLKQAYDGLIFIDTTTRARPNPSVKNVAQPQ